MTREGFTVGAIAAGVIAAIIFATGSWLLNSDSGDEAAGDSNTGETAPTDPAVSSVDDTSSTTATTATTQPPSTTTTTGPAEQVESTTTTTEAPAPPTTAAPSLAYLQDLEPTRAGAFDYVTGLFTVSGVDYPNSVAWTFTNCGSCVRSIEYNLRREWTKMEAVIGLTDESRADERINGVVTFTVVTDGSPGQTWTLRRGESMPISVDVTDVLFLELRMGDGDNFEDAVWGDALLTR